MVIGKILEIAGSMWQGVRSGTNTLFSNSKQ